MNLDRIFRSVCGPLVLCVKDKVCTQAGAQGILSLLILELKTQGWTGADESLAVFAKHSWIVEAFRENGHFLPSSPPMPPFKDMAFAVNMLTGEVDVTVNGGELAIMKLTAIEFQGLIEQGNATLDLVVPKPQALVAVTADSCCGGGCSS